jgi:hypothetical protein
MEHREITYGEAREQLAQVSHVKSKQWLRLHGLD